MTPDVMRARRMLALMLGALAVIFVSIAALLFLVHLGALAVYFAIATVGSLVTALFVLRAPSGGGT